MNVPVPEIGLQGARVAAKSRFSRCPEQTLSAPSSKIERLFVSLDCRIRLNVVLLIKI